MGCIKIDALEGKFTVKFSPADGEDIVLKDLAKEIGCEWVEIVRPRRLPQDFVLVIDEEGLLKDQPQINYPACWMYETEKHGSPIVGDCLILKEVYNPINGDRVLRALTPAECASIVMSFADTTHMRIYDIMKGLIG